MSAYTYTLHPKEIAVKTLTLEGSGQKVTWLICLAYEVQEGRGSWVGTVFSVSTNRQVRVGKRGGFRRVMESKGEAMEWYGKVAS